MKKYKVIVAYDGTDFYGWQIQPGHPTITSVLQKYFKDVFGREILIAGASRTDAGVHALGQTAVFTTDLAIDAAQLLFAWQNVLPGCILLRSIEEVPLNWNPRANVKEKTYYYHFFQERPLPMSARYGYYYRHHVDIEKLKKALGIFVGTHDFRSFCSGAEYENTVRTIHAVDVEYLPRFKTHRIIIKGPGFLRYMIRRIAGACLEVASRDALALHDLQKVLDAKNPLQQFPTAPAHGLLLYKIIYNERLKND